MAHSFSISDGTTTISLTSSGITVMRYPIQSPSPAQTNAAIGGSGDQGRTPFDLGDITETIDLLIIKDTAADVQDTVRSIQRLLESGQQQQDSGMGARLYLLAQLDSDASTWRSEILSARLVQSNAVDQLPRLREECALILTRRFFWEANAETQLSMTSSETTTPGTTVVLYNNDDASSVATNYIHIADTQVPGVLPAPLRLRITNAEVSSLGWQDFYVANYVFTNPSAFDPFLLGSEATGGDTHTWATNTNDVAFTWNLSNARLTDLAGRYYRILLAFSSASDNVYLRAEVQWTGLGIPLYVGKQVQYNSGGLVDIGALPIPPGGYNELGKNLSLVIRAQKAGGGTLIADFVQLTPAGKGLNRRFTQLGSTTPQNEGIEDNGPEGTIYYWDGTRRGPFVRGYDTPVYVWPGRTQRLRVLYRTSTWSGAVGKKLNASAWYRARREDI